MQTKIFPYSQAHLAQANAGCVPKGHPGQERMLEAAKDLEEKYRSGEITATEVLRQAAVQAANVHFRQMLLDAAAAERDADESQAPSRSDPVLDITEEMFSDDDNAMEDAVDTDTEQQESEATERSHEWTLIDWPETIPAAEGEDESLPSNRVLPEEDVDRVVVSVCLVCADHYDFHYVLANCSHQVCRTCFFQLSSCPECRAPRGTIDQAKKVSNKPSLMRADSQGRPENRILTTRNSNNKFF